MTLWRLGAALLACLVSLPTLSATAAETGFAPIAVTARPFSHFARDSSATHFGTLEFLGGLQLTSTDPRFGSLSGLDFSADDRTLVAVSDTGFWFAGTLIAKDGRPAGIAEPMLAPMLDSAGHPFTSKIAADAEGLRIVSLSGHAAAYVSFEQRPAVARFSGAHDIAAARRSDLPLPKFVNRLKANKGLEALAVAPSDGPLAGALVAIAERSLNSAGNHRGFILSGKRAGAFALVRTEPFDVTDAAFLADGDLIVLERSFSYTAAFGMRIRRIPGAAIRPGATVDGPVLIEADMGNQIDNMEGLAIRTDAVGRTILTLVSDDNGNRLLQRTILLQFALVAQPPAPVLGPAH
jgi:hypothetical protein